MSLPPLSVWLIDGPFLAAVIALWSYLAYLRLVVGPRRLRLLDALMRRYDLVLAEDTSGFNWHLEIDGFGKIDVGSLGAITYADRKLTMPYTRARRSQYAYLTCLHEIGHWVCEHRDIVGWERECLILEIESQAWRWAFENARERILVSSRKTAWAKALITYALNYPDVRPTDSYLATVRYMTAPSLSDRLAALRRAAASPERAVALSLCAS